MKAILTRPYQTLTLIGLGLVLFASSVSAQSGVVPQQQAAEPAAQPAAQPPGPNQDPIAQLNLTPEQRQQIRAIRMQSKDERAAINQRMRETQLALDKALDSDTPDEALIEQRAREAGEARAAAIRMQAAVQAKIRRVLTPEQLQTLRGLLLEQAKLQRQRRLENNANDRRRNLPNERNGMLPNERRNNPMRRPRP
jgi:Spy/CpxP family protein refolding chaperone